MLLGTGMYQHRRWNFLKTMLFKKFTQVGHGRPILVIMYCQKLDEKKSPIAKRWGSSSSAWQCPTLARVIPHYHWRYTVSLLSSGWDQVGPVLYVRQANYGGEVSLSPQFGNSVKELASRLLLKRLRQPRSFQNKRKDCGYMTKPLGQLVPVSFTHYCASTPGLSTL